MAGHEHFDELAALSAGALLSEQEQLEFHEHSKTCPECLKSEQAYREIVRSGLPLTGSFIGEFVQVARIKSDGVLRSRFLARARREGLPFSEEFQQLN